MRPLTPSGFRTIMLVWHSIAALKRSHHVRCAAAARPVVRRAVPACRRVISALLLASGVRSDHDCWSIPLHVLRNLCLASVYHAAMYRACAWRSGAFRLESVDFKPQPSVVYLLTSMDTLKIKSIGTYRSCHPFCHPPHSTGSQNYSTLRCPSLPSVTSGFLLVSLLIRLQHAGFSSADQLFPTGTAPYLQRDKVCSPSRFLQWVNESLGRVSPEAAQFKISHHSW